MSVLKYAKMIKNKGTVFMKLNKNEMSLYMSVYSHYKEMIIGGRIQAGAKLPSIRRCAQELKLSRTTIETAYMCLAADGYIISKPQSGFYVTDIAFATPETEAEKPHENKSAIRYDFSSADVDRESFDFNLWRRYIKSALRQDERLLSYGEPQGEAELREALAQYIGEKRNVICSTDNIVVGAGVQSLLHILCVVIDGEKRISFKNESFGHGLAIFRDHGWETVIGNDTAPVIYASPSHITQWGDVMNVKQRLELIHSAVKNNSIIIEDDYNNEFCYFNRPTPSLQSLAGGKDVVYIGTFSRLLLPSIRISFMVLPERLMKKYREIAPLYNQTASKTEQIALCRFIRDGHLGAQIRKLRKLYSTKTKMLADTIEEVFGNEVSVSPAENGIYVIASFKTMLTPDELRKIVLKSEISIITTKGKKGEVNVILSGTSVNSEHFKEAMLILKKIII